jgi:hypothetical protein
MVKVTMVANTMAMIVVVRDMLVLMDFMRIEGRRFVCRRCLIGAVKTGPAHFN